MARLPSGVERWSKKAPPEVAQPMVPIGVGVVEDSTTGFIGSLAYCQRSPEEKNVMVIELTDYKVTNVEMLIEVKEFIASLLQTTSQIPM
jgi:hypothetical protein